MILKSAFQFSQENFNANCSRIDDIIEKHISIFADDILFLIKKTKNKQTPRTRHKNVLMQCMFINKS